MKQLLVITAHPDDETFFFGGTIATYVNDGWNVELMVATNGEAGRSDVDDQVSRVELEEIRLRELDAATFVLGIRTLTRMGFGDKKLYKETPGRIEETIYRRMLAMIPDVVLTFDTTGFTYHPDHRRMCYSATFAFQKYAADVRRRLRSLTGTEDLPPTLPDEPKLYYAALPETTATYLVRKKILPDELNGVPVTGIPDKRITTIIDIRDVREQKVAAAQAYETQATDARRFVLAENHPLCSSEHFIFRMHGVEEVYVGKNEPVSSQL